MIIKSGETYIELISMSTHIHKHTQINMKFSDTQESKTQVDISHIF